MPEHIDADGERYYRPDSLPDPLGRARAFVADAIEHCNEHQISAETMLAQPDDILERVGLKHGLLVRLMARGNEHHEVAVMVVGDVSAWPPEDLGLLCFSPANEARGPILSFYPTDSLVTSAVAPSS